jgi:uncharacterized protein (DUF885 family)
VRIVIDQLDTLVAQSTGGTPFLSPASRDTSPEFKKAFETLVGGQLTPAFRRYRDFLQNEYLPAAREDIAVAANPDGDRCDEATIRAHSSLPMSATQVHELGLRQIDRLLNEMRAIAERSFNTSDVKALLERQVAIAMARKEIHPIGRYISGGGYVEGWALYAEALADEMKLFSSDVDRLGMLSSQAFRAARLVVDSGIHVLGWNRQQAIDYMIKAFHDRVLEDGGVPLIYLTQKIRSWISASS